jgi:hypothetical protein
MHFTNGRDAHQERTTTRIATLTGSHTPRTRRFSAIHCIATLTGGHAVLTHHFAAIHSPTIRCQMLLMNFLL